MRFNSAIVALGLLASSLAVGESMGYVDNSTVLQLVIVHRVAVAWSCSIHTVNTDLAFKHLVS